MNETWKAVLIVLVIGSLLLGVAAAVFSPSWKRHRMQHRAQAMEELAVARVLSLRETGNIFNHRPEVRISVEVTHPTRGQWEASLLWMRGVQDMQLFLPGQTFEVRFNPADPSVVVPAR